MAYNEYLADRIRNSFAQKSCPFIEKKMMGGLTFMVRDKMCVGIVKDKLMARIGKSEYDNALKKPGVSKMDFTGREMKGYVFVNDEGIDSDEQLSDWINLAIKFNRELTS